MKPMYRSKRVWCRVYSPREGCPWSLRLHRGQAFSNIRISRNRNRNCSSTQTTGHVSKLQSLKNIKTSNFEMLIVRPDSMFLKVRLSPLPATVHPRPSENTKYRRKRRPEPSEGMHRALSPNWRSTLRRLAKGKPPYGLKQSPNRLRIPSRPRRVKRKQP